MAASPVPTPSPIPAPPPAAAPPQPPEPGPARSGDRIELRGIAGFGRHGVFAAERRDGQTFVVDLVCHLDLDVAGRSDALADTLDYGGLARQVVDDIERDPVELIETLALRIAGTVLQDPRVDLVEVTVHKPQAPMPVPVTDAAVTLVRRRMPPGATDPIAFPTSR